MSVLTKHLAALDEINPQATDKKLLTNLYLQPHPGRLPLQTLSCATMDGRGYHCGTASGTTGDDRGARSLASVSSMTDEGGSRYHLQGNRTLDDRRAGCNQVVSGGADDREFRHCQAVSGDFNDRTPARSQTSSACLNDFRGSSCSQTVGATLDDRGLGRCETGNVSPSCRLGATGGFDDGRFNCCSQTTSGVSDGRTFRCNQTTSGVSDGRTSRCNQMPGASLNEHGANCNESINGNLESSRSLNYSMNIGALDECGERSNASGRVKHDGGASGVSVQDSCDRGFCKGFVSGRDMDVAGCSSGTSNKRDCDARDNLAVAPLCQASNDCSTSECSGMHKRGLRDNDEKRAATAAWSLDLPRRSMAVYKAWQEIEPRTRGPVSATYSDHKTDTAVPIVDEDNGHFSDDSLENQPSMSTTRFSDDARSVNTAVPATDIMTTSSNVHLSVSANCQRAPEHNYDRHFGLSSEALTNTSVSRLSGLTLGRLSGIPRLDTHERLFGQQSEEPRSPRKISPDEDTQYHLFGVCETPAKPPSRTKFPDTHKRVFGKDEENAALPEKTRVKEIDTQERLFGFEASPSPSIIRRTKAYKNMHLDDDTQVRVFGDDKTQYDMNRTPYIAERPRPIKSAPRERITTHDRIFGAAGESFVEPKIGVDRADDLHRSPTHLQKPISAVAITRDEQSNNITKHAAQSVSARTAFDRSSVCSQVRKLHKSRDFGDTFERVYCTSMPARRQDQSGVSDDYITRTAPVNKPEYSQIFCEGPNSIIDAKVSDSGLTCSVSMCHAPADTVVTSSSRLSVEKTRTLADPLRDRQGTGNLHLTGEDDARLKLQSTGQPSTASCSRIEDNQVDDLRYALADSRVRGIIDKKKKNKQNRNMFCGNPVTGEGYGPLEDEVMAKLKGCRER